MTEQQASPQITPLWRDATDIAITATDIGEFLAMFGLNLSALSCYDGPDIPERDSGAMIVVTWLPGAGFSLEQMLDTPAFQVRAIGPQGNPDDARILAHMIDRTFTGRHWPAYVGDRYVVEVRRAGGSPALDRVDDADRTHYVCTYLADVEAG